MQLRLDFVVLIEEQITAGNVNLTLKWLALHMPC